MFLELFCYETSFDIHTLIINYKSQNFIICVIWLECIEQVTGIIQLFMRFHNGSMNVFRFCKGL